VTVGVKVGVVVGVSVGVVVKVTVGVKVGVVVAVKVGEGSCTEMVWPEIGPPETVIKFPPAVAPTTPAPVMLVA
jgi:hypothetical protein